MAKWNLVGQVGNVIKKKNCYLINIAENKYSPIGKGKKWEKDYTIWFNCVSKFEPNVSIGDKVMVEGEFYPSENPYYPFTMQISHIGVIKSGSR